MAGKTHQLEALLVRAVYDFEDVQEGEIKLSAGDIISVSSEIDENWWRGINLSRPEASVGNFPRSFVTEIALPILRASDKLLLSTASFQTDVNGDLNFGPNEVIVLESYIDENWCRGTIGNTSGIFPNSFTKEIHLSCSLNEELLNNGSNVSCLPSSNQSKPLAIGLAVVDFDARFCDEISFRDGDTIEIFEVFDASLALGLNKSNPDKVGQFPLEFVYIQEGEKNLKIPIDNRNSSSKFDWWKNPEAELQLKKKQKNVTNQFAPSFEDQTAPLTTFDCEIDDYKESDNAIDGDTSTCQAGDVSNVDREEKNEIIAGDSSSTTCFSDLTETNVSVTCKTSSSSDETQNAVLNFVENLIANIPFEIYSIQNRCEGPLGHLASTSKESPTDEDYFTASSDIIISFHRSDHESNAKAEDESWKDYQGISLSSSPMPPPLPLSLPPPLSPASSSSLMFLLHADDFTGDIQEAENCEANDDGNINNNNNINNDEENSDNNSNIDEEISDNEERKCSSVVEKEPTSLKSLELPTSSVEEIKIFIPQSSSELLSQTGQTVHEDNPVSPNARSRIPVVPKTPSKPKPPAKPPKPKPSQRSKKDDSESNGSSRVVRDTTESWAPESNQNVCNDKPNKPPPAPNKPKVTIESKSSFHKATNSGRGGFLFKSGPSFAKRKSTFYVESFLGNEVEATEQPDASESSLSPSSDVLTLGPVVSFKKVSGKSEIRDDKDDQSPNKQGFAVPSGCSLNTPSPRKRATAHQVVPENNLSGAGALMTGPLDPCHLVSSPHSSPHKNDPLSNESSLPKKSPPVPLRPAPPKPTRSFASKDSAKDKTRSKVLDADDDEGGSQVNDSIIEDIERRITETEQDLEKCIIEQSSILNEKYERTDLALPQEAAENLKFYQANIQGLTDELTQLRAILKEIIGEEDSPVAVATSSEQQQPPHPTTSVHLSLPPHSGRIDTKIARRRKEEQRKKAVDELVQTELIFLQAICTCYDIFFQKNPPIECPPSIDLDFLFGNMHEVIDLSQKFYNLLEAATNGKDFHEQVVGSCFEEMVDDLKRVHGVYCRNHDEVISALARLDTNKEAQAYLQERLNILRGKMMVFDLGGILIKPVQRIMKYPLLIGELIKYTEEDHPDYKHLKAAEAIMKEVAVHINEYKRRKDLVFKYKRPIDGGFSKKISKFTVHSIKKKFNRFMTPAQSLDESFQLEETKFKEMNIIIRCLIRDINHYLDFLQVSLMDLESFSLEVSDHCREDHKFKADLLGMDEAYSRLHNHICHKFKEKVENDIIPILDILLFSYQGPREVIKKRQHKLLDFHNALNKFNCVPETEQTKLMKDELDFLRRTYEAMNCQLLEDLPKLYQLSVSIVKDCVQLLARYQVEFASLIKEELLRVLSLGLFQSPSSSTQSMVSSSLPSSNDIMNEFTLLHLKEVDRLSKLSFIPRSFNPSKADGKQKADRKSSLQLLAGDLINSTNFPRPQLEDERTRLKKRFQPDKLYVVTKDFDGGQILDLVLTSGTLVGVIKEEDPMKNKERFFVCNGAQQGFVLRSHLKPFEISGEDQIGKVIDEVANDNDDNSLSASSNLVDYADEESCNEVNSNEDVVQYDDVAHIHDNDVAHVDDDDDVAHVDDNDVAHVDDNDVAHVDKDANENMDFKTEQ